MKVGDYVRTKNKGIKKIIALYSNAIFDGQSRIEENQIIKSSPSTIDLIEIGDLVRIEVEKDNTNVFEVCAINYNDNEIGVFNNNFNFDWASMEQVKSIVTKEQFEQMEYRIGE